MHIRIEWTIPRGKILKNHYLATIMLRLIIRNYPRTVSTLEALNTRNEVVILSEGKHYIHLFSEDRRFEKGPNSLLHEQFPPGLVILRTLADSYHGLEIVDDLFDGAPSDDEIIQSTGLSLLVRSMELPVETYLFDENHKWFFQGGQHTFDIVVKADRTRPWFT